MWLSVDLLTLGRREEDGDEFLLGLREQRRHRLVERVLVLEEPPVNVVRHRACENINNSGGSDHGEPRFDCKIQCATKASSFALGFEASGDPIQNCASKTQ